MNTTVVISILRQGQTEGELGRKPISTATTNFKTILSATSPTMGPALTPRLSSAALRSSSVKPLGSGISASSGLWTHKTKFAGFIECCSKHDKKLQLECQQFPDVGYRA